MESIKNKFRLTLFINEKTIKLIKCYNNAKLFFETVTFYVNLICISFVHM